TVTPAADGSPTTLSATFTDTNTNEQASSYTATIDWGDDSTSSVTVTASGGGSEESGGSGGSGGSGHFYLTGTHTYQNSGPFTLSVTVKDTGGASPLPRPRPPRYPMPSCLPSGI